MPGAAPTSPLEPPERLREPLSESETRVLRYLPTNLSQSEIAGGPYRRAPTRQGIRCVNRPF
jgi:LuxR family maltose regulon positive regulatory protein